MPSERAPEPGQLHRWGAAESALGTRRRVAPASAIPSGARTFLTRHSLGDGGRGRSVHSESIAAHRPLSGRRLHAKCHWATLESDRNARTELVESTPFFPVGEWPMTVPAVSRAAASASRMLFFTTRRGSSYPSQVLRRPWQRPAWHCAQHRRAPCRRTD